MRRRFNLLREAFFSDSSLGAVVSRQRDQAPMDLHGHEFFEIVIVLGGSGLHVTPRGEKPIVTGDVLVVNRRQSHGYRDTLGLDIANILVADEVMRDAEAELGTMPGYHALFTMEPVRRNSGGGDARIHLGSQDLVRVEYLIDSMEAEGKRLEDGGDAMTRVWLKLLLGFLARRYQAGDEEKQNLDARIGGVLARIDKSPETPVTLAQLAREAGMSERSFLRSFREATGLSPVDYVLRARVRRAERLLMRSPAAETITEIAFACGFNDSNYFSRVFRRFALCSPRDFRAARRGLLR
ncbi:hypothetical protein DB345_12900 [Spartobacteria bacterium LR76]|nr:hypothetical protein DB345_12900 [Spartobacteria bacterium LR76]